MPWVAEHAEDLADWEEAQAAAEINKEDVVREDSQNDNDRPDDVPAKASVVIKETNNNCYYYDFDVEVIERFSGVAMAFNFAHSCGMGDCCGSVGLQPETVEADPACTGVALDSVVPVVGDIGVPRDVVI